MSAPNPNAILRGVKDQELRKLVRCLVDQGWTLDRTKGSHIKLTCPNTGQVMFGPSTTSDWRAVRNFRARARRMGADV